MLGIYTPGYQPEPGMFGTLTSPTSNCGTGITNQLVRTGNVYICAIRAGYLSGSATSRQLTAIADGDENRYG